MNCKIRKGREKLSNLNYFHSQMAITSINMVKKTLQMVTHLLIEIFHKNFFLLIGVIHEGRIENFGF